MGGRAVLAAAAGETGKAVTIRRLSDNPYQYTTELHDVGELANYEKKVPLEWVNETRTGMLRPFLDYVHPLVQAELTPMYVDGLPYHIRLR